MLGPKRNTESIEARSLSWCRHLSGVLMDSRGPVLWQDFEV